MKNIIIFDLDGTLALIDHRKHLVEKETAFEQWFFSLPHKKQIEYKAKYSPQNLMDWFVTEKWKADWDKFYDLCDQDSPNIPVIKMYDALGFYEDMELYIFSGRSEVVRDKTTAWLNNFGIFISVDHLLMRPEGDFTPDEALKETWLQEIGGPERVFCVFDDRDKVVAMWRRHGITCFQVAPGNF